MQALADAERALAAQLYASDPRLFDAMCAAGVYDGAQAKAAKVPYVVIVFGLRRPRPLGRGGSKPLSFHRLI